MILVGLFSVVYDPLHPLAGAGEGRCFLDEEWTRVQQKPQLRRYGSHQHTTSTMRGPAC
jgi:hypothetical protein